MHTLHVSNTKQNLHSKAPITNFQRYFPRTISVASSAISLSFTESEKRIIMQIERVVEKTTSPIFVHRAVGRHLENELFSHRYLPAKKGAKLLRIPFCAAPTLAPPGQVQVTLLFPTVTGRVQTNPQPTNTDS